MSSLSSTPQNHPPLNQSPLSALVKALQSQAHPRMLRAILLPIVVAVLSFVILLFVAWRPLDHWLLSTAMSWSWFEQMTLWWGMDHMSRWLIGLITTVALFGVSVVLGLTIAAIVVTPMAVNLLSQTHYPQLRKRGQQANRKSIVNALKVSIIFVLGWLITLPLWLVPMMGAVLSVFWSTYAFSQISKVDALVEHASPDEMRYILKRHGGGFWVIGLICALISLIPLMGLIMPVFTILACTHYALSLLQELRQKDIAIEVAEQV